MRYFCNVRPTVLKYVSLFSSPNDQRRFLEQQLDVTSEPFRLVYDMSIRCGFVRTFSNKKYNDGTGRPVPSSKPDLSVPGLQDYTTRIFTFSFWKIPDSVLRHPNGMEIAVQCVLYFRARV